MIIEQARNEVNPERVTYFFIMATEIIVVFLSQVKAG